VRYEIPSLAECYFDKEAVNIFKVEEVAAVLEKSEP
jgi:hypothetical protein